MNLLDIQDKIKKFTKNKDMNSTVEIRIIDLASEVEDVLFSLICIANETDTNLEESLNYVLEKYEKRFSDKGDIESDR